MPTSSHNYAIQFRKNVSDKYIIYNSLFAALPYSGVANVGALLPILLQTCEEGFSKASSSCAVRKVVENGLNQWCVMMETP